MRRPGDHGAWAMTAWMLRYPLRRWRALLVVLATMAAEIVFVILGPWPMKLIVDNVLSGQPLGDPLAGAVRLLGGDSREGLLLIAIGATVVLFLARWGLGVIASFAKIAFGQRMVYDLAADVFAHLQRLSLRFHSRN